MVPVWVGIAVCLLPIPALKFLDFDFAHGRIHIHEASRGLCNDFHHSITVDIAVERFPVV
jgi:hypothetical protein